VPDVGPYYQRATLAVTPLHSGGGTRLKVIEALARRTPLVSTSFGCQGFDLDHGTELLVADDPDAFARACVAVISDPALRERLVIAGRRRYETDLTSKTAAQAVAQVATSVLRPNRLIVTDCR
jgi:glycosyltransferase involved in cell wall biosynthesis